MLMNLRQEALTALIFFNFLSDLLLYVVKNINKYYTNVMSHVP